MGSDSSRADSFHEVETTHSEYFADVNYFHNRNFSGRVLMMEIIPDRPDETDSTLGMDLTLLGLKIVPISSQVLAANLDFFGKWFSNDMMTMSTCHRSVLNLRIHASEAAALMNNLHDLNCNTLEPNKRPLLVRWIAPLFGKAKLNVDGSSKAGNPRVAGCGGVLRCHCAFIFAFSRCLEFGTSSVYAELSALKYGLMLCCKNNIRHEVVVETDSLLVVNWLNNETRPPLQYRELLEDILKVRNHMMFCKVSHVYREANSLADGLANYGALGNDASFSCPSQLPKHLLAIYALDSAGVPTFRSTPALV